MHHWKRLGRRSPGLIGLLAIGEGSTLLLAPALAQVIPDTTLGNESSTVIPNVDLRGDTADLIDGGAARGTNLFHSFEQFGIVTDQRVYFSNPANIENIVSRVTGNTRSDIDGTLGVDGPANLFLINPNGIVFGADAQLDVEGAFLASTADRISFSDGYSFQATNPNAAPLVTVNIPLGAQFGNSNPATLENNANLTAGEDLTLSAGEIISHGTLTSSSGQLNVDAVAGNATVKAVTAESATL
ncbi:MAG: filamentous hemagglutinin N-terminal domain-containing protein, partial [Cyanobacteria bacterium J06642_11]